MIPEQLEEIRPESFPKLRKDNILQVQEAQGTPNRIKIKFFKTPMNNINCENPKVLKIYFKQLELGQNLVTVYLLLIDYTEKLFAALTL